jgi:hypothetical protein
MLCPIAEGPQWPSSASAIPERSAPQDGWPALVPCPGRSRWRGAIATWSSRRSPRTARTANEASGIARAACPSPRARWPGRHPAGARPFLGPNNASEQPLYVLPSLTCPDRRFHSGVRTHPCLGISVGLQTRRWHLLASPGRWSRGPSDARSIQLTQQVLGCVATRWVWNLIART